jgi:ribosome-associated protein
VANEYIWQPTHPYLGAMANTRFELQGEYVELNQLLKLVGACESGGQGKQLVAEGLVRVDGEVELRKTCKIRVGQLVEFEDLTIEVVGL